MRRLLSPVNLVLCNTKIVITVILQARKLLLFTNFYRRNFEIL